MTGADLQTDRPHSARVYDYWLGGKDNYAADRAAAEDLLQHVPELRIIARSNRAFMHRAARFLAEAGIDQFLDIGTGIPTEPNLHQIVHAVEPAAGVVYVDNDPLVLAHAAALMADRGRTTFVRADLREPASILGSAALRETIDLARPVALSLISVLHFLPDDEQAYEVVAALVDALAPGSYLALSHGSSEVDPERSRRGVDLYNQRGVPFRLRSHAEIAQFCSGLELLDPGIVPVHDWRPDPVDVEQDRTGQAFIAGGVARKRP
jgi:hypothetical protein